MNRLTGAASWAPILWILGLVLCLPFQLRAGDEFVVKEVRTRLDQGVYVLDADIEFGFSPEALEALDNGVPLTVELRFQVRSADAWIWDDSAADLRLRYAVRYKPISGRYEVYRLPGDRGRSFVSREAAIAALGEIRGVQVVSKDRLEPDLAYLVYLKVELDIEELPLPLRPMAYLRPAWKLRSSWTEWPLTP